MLLSCETWSNQETGPLVWLSRNSWLFIVDRLYILSSTFISGCPGDLLPAFLLYCCLLHTTFFLPPITLSLSLFNSPHFNFFVFYCAFKCNSLFRNKTHPQKEPCQPKSRNMSSLLAFCIPLFASILFLKTCYVFLLCTCPDQSRIVLLLSIITESIAGKRIHSPIYLDSWGIVGYLSIFDYVLFSCKKVLEY